MNKDPRIITCEMIPSGVSGNLTLKNEVLTEMKGRVWQGESPMDAGETYVSITENGRLWMSNTPDEKRTISYELAGMGATAGMDILVGGLGLGYFLERFQRERNIPNSLTVVEFNPHVIELVYPTYSCLPWLKVQDGDILAYGVSGPRKFYDWCYVDVWGDYNIDLLESMKKLRRSLLPVMKSGRGRVILWKECELKYHRRREQREERISSIWDSAIRHAEKLVG